MPKINQYTTSLICKCVGRPSSGTTAEQNIGGRIQCKRSITIPINRIGPMGLDSKLIGKETQPFLENAGWLKLKTLGYFQRLCPECSKYVLGMRERDKITWG